MLFGRGNWAVFGVKKSSHNKFRKALSDDTKRLEISQLGASIKARFLKQSSVGINPFGVPRKDEKLEINGTDSVLVQYFSKPFGEREMYDSWMAVAKEGFGFAPEFELPVAGANPYYGFWLVVNAQKDVTDAASKKEQFAYDEMSRPFKFLNKDEKKAVETAVTMTAVVERRQFPVLVDFENERVYAACATDEEVEVLVDILEYLDADTFALAWQFGSPDWVTKFINAVNDSTKFVDEMSARAEELTRFYKNEIEKLDDKMMENIVSTFYALSELDTGQWCGLTTPARIRLYAPADPVSAAGVSTAFSLLRLSEDSSVAASSAIFQSLDSKIVKKTDTEKQFRKNLFTLDLNDNINLLDSGAALLRGFDLPGFKKEIKTAIKAQTSPLEISYYWTLWLTDMREAIEMFVDNVVETLGLDKKRFGLLPFAEEKTTKEEI
jgi:hypothetical protein